MTDPEVLAEINLMIEDWERRARLLDKGGAESSAADSRVMQRLYESKINFAISSLYDDGFYVKLGDEMNGFRAEGQCMTWHDVEEWLAGMARIYYPTSAFAVGN